MNICTLTRTETYIETLSIRPLEAMADSFEILIQSQLLSARDPSALQVRHRVIVSAVGLAGLHNAISQCLTLQA